MLAVEFDWQPVVMIVTFGAILVVALRLSIWYGTSRAKSHTRHLLGDDGD
ncbi:MAG: hypothetical protein OXU20_17735 [Myxococcales bacterium]|nr:hypothetical protein [Myxococcales bacterium]